MAEKGIYDKDVFYLLLIDTSHKIYLLDLKILKEYFMVVNSMWVPEMEVNILKAEVRNCETQ